MTDLYLVRRNQFASLWPADAESEEYIRRQGQGDIIRARISKPRNAGLHRKFFAMLKVVFDNQERYRSIEQLREVLLIEAGHCETFADLHGQLLRRAKSISYAKCDEDTFETIYRNVWEVACDFLHIADDELLDAMEAFA